ncbi:MAG: hypothetical protein Q6361_08420, partial [Candidatus Hermodarchaeota archaeon]|nr:hypothetical protein [Candidatus Hermodarchaeota archaeon]
DGPSGVLALDISNPSTISLRDDFNTNGWAWGIELQTNVAIVADGNAGITVLNITDPDNMLFYDSALGSGISMDVFLSGIYAYVADGDQGLRILDIQNPTNVIERGQYISSDIVEGVFIDGNYGYLAVAEIGLDIVDVSNPDVIQFVGSYDTPGWAHDVVVSGDFAYVADDTRGLTIVDETDKANPIYGPFSKIPDKALGVTLTAPTCFVADETGGFKVFDVEDLITYGYHAIGQSRNIFSGLTTRRFTTAYLTATTTSPVNTQLTIQLSADGGNHWETVIPDSLHHFNYMGNNLKWRVIFDTTENSTTPELFSLSIAYDSVLVNPKIIGPHDNDNVWYTNYPFAWEPVEGAHYYILQLDNSTSFDSPFLLNVTTTETVYWVDWIGDGIWYWRVATVDSTGDRGFFCPTISFNWDVLPPNAPTLLAPEYNFITNETLSFIWSPVPDAVSYTLEFKSWSIGWGHPDYTFSGLEETSYTPDWNMTYLAEERLWDWRVSAVDRWNRAGEPTYGRFLIDREAPEIYVESQPIVYREICQYEEYIITFSAHDDSGEIEWTISDPLLFELSVDGFFCTASKIVDFPEGTHTFTIYATDKFCYSSSYEFEVIVQICIPVPGFPPEALVLGFIAALVPVIVLRHRRRNAITKH